MLLSTNVIDLWLSISILIFYYSLPRNDLKLLLQCRTLWPQCNYAAFYVVLLYCAPLNYLIQQSLIFFNTSAILSLLKSQLSQKLYRKLPLISPLPFIYKHTPVISLSSCCKRKNASDYTHSPWIWFIMTFWSFTLISPFAWNAMFASLDP